MIATIALVAVIAFAGGIAGAVVYELRSRWRKDGAS